MWGGGGGGGRESCILDALTVIFLRRSFLKLTVSQAVPLPYRFGVEHGTRS